MKHAMLFIALVTFCFSLSAREIQSLEKKSTRISVARLVELIKLSDQSDININLVVQDLGGTTDVSPTQELFFTLYIKGEMFSTDATFHVASVFSWISSVQTAPGIYDLKIKVADDETSMPVEKMVRVDAQKAIAAIRKVSCEDFDCPASDNFKTTIDIIDL